MRAATAPLAIVIVAVVITIVRGLPIVLLLGVPTLAMDPEMGLWPRTGSTLPPGCRYTPGG